MTKPRRRQGGAVFRATLLVVGLGLAGAGCEGKKFQGRTVWSWTQDLDSKEDFQRRKACEVLADIGPEAAEAVPKLAELLDDPNPGVAAFAATALQKIGGSGRAPLEQAMKGDEPQKALVAAVAVERMEPGYAPAVDIIASQTMGVGNADLAKEAQEAAVKVGKPIVPKIAGFLADSYAPARFQALDTLRQMGPEAQGATDEIAKLVEDKDPKVAQKALRALAEIGPREKVEPIFRRVIKTKDEDLADVASMMMKHIGAYESASGYEKK